MRGTSTARRAALAVRPACVVLLVAALGLAGCGERYDIRTGRATLERAMSRAFKRNYAAQHRMRTGRADRLVIRHADVRCSPRSRQPADEARAWPWRCRVRWYVRGRPEPGLATYGVQVGARGCFHARSGAFPDRIHERVLDREGPNPLVYIRSCP
ncbi:MAG TPA: hypothetical protein VNB64_06940 [Solirubrobacteraceae bacterium]|nr:hypothetical protein [Solirubrobacteraceae bacterium]